MYNKSRAEYIESINNTYKIKYYQINYNFNSEVTFNLKQNILEC